MTFRTALITGASSGIGMAFARNLPRATNLLLTGRNHEKLVALASELALNGREVRTVTADLATPEGRRAVIGAAEDAGIDLLINNAGLGRIGRVIDNTAEREAEMVQVNIVAATELTRALLPGMLKRAPGTPPGETPPGETASGVTPHRCGVIFVASAAAFMPLPYFATYAASKAFLLHYAEALSEELSHDPIDVLALCPGATETQFFARAGVERPSFTTFHSAERVAREGLQMLGQRNVHVVGPTNYLTSLVSRFLPRGWVTYAAERVMRELK